MTANIEITGQHPSQEIVTEHTQISLWTIFISYFIIGLTAFGMAIIQ